MPERRRVWSTLTTRAVLVTCRAALVSVMVTALVAFPLSIRAANTQARKGLADKDQIAPDLINSRHREAGQQRLTQLLFFFLIDPAPPGIYPLPPHAPLPI